MVVKTTITHVLTSPAHQLELVRGGREFVCYKCTETGTGPRYRCKNCDDLVLHRECATPTINHNLRLVAGEGLLFFCEQCTEIGTGDQLGCTTCGDCFLHPGCAASSEVNQEETEEADQKTTDGIPATMKTTITHILTSPAHQLELVRGGREFVCYKCTETGTGSRYQCKNCDDLLLHRGCATPTVTHTLSHIASEGPGFFCEQCTEIGTGDKHGCTDCGDFFLHRGCATKEEEEDQEEEDQDEEEEEEEEKMTKKKNKMKKKKKMETEDKETKEEGKEEKATSDDEFVPKNVAEEGKKVEEEKRRKLEDITNSIGSLTIVRLNISPIAASSTASSSTYKNGYEIGHTLTSSSMHWAGVSSQNEWLLYRLPSGFINVVDEIQFYYYGNQWKYCAYVGAITSDNNYNWLYTSPECPLMDNINYYVSYGDYYTRVSFKLPSPFCCINGGVVKIEFNRIQGSTYTSSICVREVVVCGRQLQVDENVISSFSKACFLLQSIL